MTSTDHHSSHDDFFTQLTELFTTRQNQSHGSIYLTQKRLQPVGAASPVDSAMDMDLLDPPALIAAPVIVRATNGDAPKKDPKTFKIVKGREDKVKLSTIVEQKDLEQFFLRYAEVCKGGMTALKKKEKEKKRKKAKGKKGKGAAGGEGK